jgi:hypothetical protein
MMWPTAENAVLMNKAYRFRLPHHPTHNLQVEDGGPTPRRPLPFKSFLARKGIVAVCLHYRWLPELAICHRQVYNQSGSGIGQ